MNYDRKINIKVSEKDMYVVAPISFMRNNQYTLYEKGVYLYLKSYGVNSNMAFPSIDKIANDLSLSRPTVIKTIKSLEEKKGVVIRKGKRGTKENNTYYLTSIDGLFGIFDIKDFEKNKVLIDTLMQPSENKNL
ncbi:helix-turn-helix domain-containing protein [Clostridium thermobutyricum]|uniref:helix-turn-helix domain-containing protein n=1 Tax=Clostridium thermobutyricum TaxID=29372 RepID=UPI0018A8E450|nr:helix-turn-helix domain-containing protein [Clostridium thermobutyricum]